MFVPTCRFGHSERCRWSYSVRHPTVVRRATLHLAINSCIDEAPDARRHITVERTSSQIEICKHAQQGRKTRYYQYLRRDVLVCKYLISFFFISGVDSWDFLERLFEKHSTSFIEEGECSRRRAYRGA